MSSIRLWLGHSAVPFVAVILAVALTLPSLRNGIVLDDIAHRNVLLADIPMSVRFLSALNLFCFVNEGGAWKTRAERKFGDIPWWAPEDRTFCFFRPLTSITHWLDYQFWPDTPALMHLQSLTWFGILVFLAAFLYRRILKVRWAAGLAALFFAVDPAHGWPAGWLANRNILIAGVFGVLCIIAHDQWKQKGRRSGFLLGPLCFALALLSAEAGIAIGAYILSYTLFLERGSIRKRLMDLIPYAIVFIPWVLAYVLLECGTRNMPGYTDPLKEPLLYFKAIFFRIPVYLLSQWILPVDIYFITWPSIVRWAGLIFSALLIFILFPLLRKDRFAQFWTLGMFLSLLPICAARPGARNLLFVGLGAMGLLAQWICWMINTGGSLPPRPWRIAARVMLFIFILFHSLLHPILLPKASSAVVLINEQSKKAGAYLPPPSETETRKFILINNPSFLFGAGVMGQRMSEGQFAPYLLMSAGNHTLTCERKDSFIMEVLSEKGSLTDLDSHLLGKEYAMQPGQIVRVGDVVIEVLEIRNSLPSRAQFRFKLPLENPSLLWLFWENDAYRSFSPPKVGEKVTIDGASLPIR